MFSLRRGTMRELLKANVRRRLELIEQLMASKDWSRFSDLANTLNSSVRILKEDVAYLRQSYLSITIESSQLGIRLNQESSSSIKDVYRYVLKQTLAFQLLEVLFFDETLSLEDLANKLYSSPSTIYRTINQLNDYFIEHYDCYIETSPCRFVGNETNIRLYYKAYFSESSTLMEWPFKDIDESTINKAFDIILSFVPHDLDMDFAYYEQIKPVVMVNLIRYKNGHYIETSQDKSDVFKRIVHVFKFFIPSTKLKKLPDINDHYIYQVFSPYIRKGPAYNIKQLNKMKAKNNEVGDALRYLEFSLINLASNLNISINIDLILFGVYNTSFGENEIPTASFILHDHIGIFLQKVRQFSPAILQQFHEFIEGFRQRLGKKADINKTNLLVYTLFNYWDNLFSDLHKKNNQITVTLLSQHHHTHAKVIQNLFEFTLSSDVSISIYDQPAISVDRLNDLDTDLIISNFRLLDGVNKESLIIQDFPSPQDLSLINSTIQRIRDQKSLDLN